MAKIISLKGIGYNRSIESEFRTKYGSTLDYYKENQSVLHINADFITSLREIELKGKSERKFEEGRGWHDVRETRLVRSLERKGELVGIYTDESIESIIAMINE